MSHYDYVTSREIAKGDPPFAALVMAALRKADSENYARITEAFPEITAEFRYRYWSSGGYLPDEVGYNAEFDDNLPKREPSHDVPHP